MRYEMGLKWLGRATCQEVSKIKLRAQPDASAVGRGREGLACDSRGTRFSLRPPIARHVEQVPDEATEGMHYRGVILLPIGREPT